MKRALHALGRDAPGDIARCERAMRSPLAQAFPHPLFPTLPLAPYCLEVKNNLLVLEP